MTFEASLDPAWITETSLIPGLATFTPMADRIGASARSFGHDSLGQKRHGKSRMSSAFLFASGPSSRTLRVCSVWRRYCRESNRTRWC